MQRLLQEQSSKKGKAVPGSAVGAKVPCMCCMNVNGKADLTVPADSGAPPVSGQKPRLSSAPPVSRQKPRWSSAVHTVAVHTMQQQLLLMDWAKQEEQSASLMPADVDGGNILEAEVPLEVRLHKGSHKAAAGSIYMDLDIIPLQEQQHSFCT